MRSGRAAPKRAGAGYTGAETEAAREEALMKFAWTGDVPWRTLEEGVRVQARRNGLAWMGNRPWRAVGGRCVVQANFINDEAPAQQRGGAGGAVKPVEARDWRGAMMMRWRRRRRGEERRGSDRAGRGTGRESRKSNFSE